MKKKSKFFLISLKLLKKCLKVVFNQFESFPEEIFLKFAKKIFL
jgi:hypothetical protein